MRNSLLLTPDQYCVHTSMRVVAHPLLSMWTSTHDSNQLQPPPSYPSFSSYHFCFLVSSSHFRLFLSVRYSASFIPDYGRQSCDVHLRLLQHSVLQLCMKTHHIIEFHKLSTEKKKKTLTDTPCCLLACIGTHQNKWFIVDSLSSQDPPFPLFCYI